MTVINLLGSLVIVASAYTAAPAPAVIPAACSAAAFQQDAPAANIQLADEITRRIRRLGIQIIRFPNARPSEILGVYC